MDLAIKYQGLKCARGRISAPFTLYEEIHFQTLPGV